MSTSGNDPRLSGPRLSREHRVEYVSRLKDADRRTRKPQLLWDRIRILLLIIGSWVFLLWADVAGNPLLSFEDALAHAVRDRSWLLFLAAAEVVRQLHYLVSEHWEAYHAFWMRRVFAGWNHWVETRNAWMRFRMARLIKLLFILFIIDLGVAAALNLPVATAIFQLPYIAIRALPFVLQLAFGLFFGMVQILGFFLLLTRGGVETIMPDDIQTRFTDVKGQDPVLDRIKESLTFLENPASIEDKGGKVPGGILLWGPPGTGKTLMAQALAGETGKPFVLVEPGAFVNTFFGIGILKVWMLFRRLRKLALRWGGVICFLDEADSLGNRGVATQGEFMSPAEEKPKCRGLAYLSEASRELLAFPQIDASGGGEPPRRIRHGIIFGGFGRGDIFALQRLLGEMDGLKKPRGFFNRRVRRWLGMKPKPPFKFRIMMILATNLPTALDPALLRPGRIDRKFKVGYPSKEGRKETFRYYLGKTRNAIDEDELERIALQTPYWTGADIEAIVNESLIVAIREGHDAITFGDFLRAKQLKELGPPEDQEYIERERHAIAVHEACHAVIAHKARTHAIVDLATIEKGGEWLGLVSSVRPEDRFTRWRTEYEADVMTAIASLAGERMFYHGDNSSGVSGDLMNATNLAVLMEGHWGMGETITAHPVLRQHEVGPGPTPGRREREREQQAETLLAYRVEQKLQKLYADTAKLLEDNRSAVLALAFALEQYRTLSGDDVIAVIEGVPGPTVDGRPYHDPVFQRGLEEYHERSVRAHELNLREPIPMPVLVPVAPGGALGNGEVDQPGQVASGPPRPDGA
jgi:ATP-dependent Zn protease